MRAKKSLGQNFLTSKGVARDVVAASGVTTRDVVLEVGPGKGFLTEELLRVAGKVIAVEKDDRLAGLMREKFAQHIAEGKLEVAHGDILEFEPGAHGLKEGAYTVVSNIPYYITGQILRIFLESDTQPNKMVLMVQKEVAERIVARDGKESILSISVKAYGEPRYVKKVPARYFSPKPKVDSAVLSIENISKKRFPSALKEKHFFDIVKIGFSHKRKKLLGNLKNFYALQELEEGFERCSISQTARAENLSLNQWLCLSKRIKTEN